METGEHVFGLHF
jgi:hypothetical protein